MKLKRPSATGIVLGLLCLMYLITYVDRVNVATAGDAIRRELSLSNTQLGLVFSAFAYAICYQDSVSGIFRTFDDATVPASRPKSSRDFSPDSISPS